MIALADALKVNTTLEDLELGVIFALVALNSRKTHNIYAGN